MKPVTLCLVLLPLLLTAVAPAQIVLPGQIKPAAPTPVASPGAALKDSTPEDYEKLVLYGHALQQCGLNTLAAPMFLMTDEKVKTMQQSSIRIRMCAELMLYYAKTGQNLPRMREIATQLRAYLPKLDASQKPLRALVLIALAHAAVAGNTGAKADIQAAMLEIKSLNTPDLELRAHQTMGAVLLRETNTPGESILDFQTVLRRLSNAKGLELAELCQQMADYQILAKNKTGADLARQDARLACSNLWDAPLLEPDQILTQAAAMMEDHPRAAQEGYWQRALNEIFSLMILKQNGAEEARRQFRLSDPVLLAYAAYYARENGDVLPATLFYQSALSALPGELESLPRAEACRVLSECQRGMNNLPEALTSINTAEKILQSYDPLPKAALAAVYEEKTLVLAMLGQRAEAIKILTDLQGENQPEAAARIEFYNWVLANQKMDPRLIFGQPQNLKATREAYLREKRDSQAGAATQSLLASENSASGKRSAADALIGLNQDRPNAPTATALDPQVYVQTGRWAKAIPVLIQMQAQKETAENWALLGECYCATSQWAKAAEALEQSLKMNPNNGRATEYLKTAKSRLQK